LGNIIRWRSKEMESRKTERRTRKEMGRRKAERRRKR
jgi:hypothetical protein